VAQAQLQGGDSPAGQAAPPQAGPAMPQGLAANLARLSVKPQGAPGAPAPFTAAPRAQAPGPAPGSAAWEDKLNANTAGLAGNAEDFTKEFMKQLGGGQ
jgi:hypothetical protein